MPESTPPTGLVRWTAGLVVAGCLLAGCGHGVGHEARAGGQAGQATSPSPASHGHAASADPAVQLRSTLELLLGEHVRLTVLLMRDRVNGGTDRAAVTLKAVDGNADELGDAVEGLVGEAGAAPFRQLWAAHVDQLQDYAAGLADDDAAARD
ncbi:MAG: copper amine oxidase, partial [Frankiales bacterium]|nr:copper amine oxidase [Frankiales bacterium]